MAGKVFNPFLPLGVCIPDGEPHIFGDRVYLFGSHDKEGGHTFCMEDYCFYSAPIDDLTNWTAKGISYQACKDPLYDKFSYMYAPDVVKGNDGRYYLYYSMSGEYGVGGYTNPISVAVSDYPDGPYEFLDIVRNPDGTPMLKYICFDPAVINDEGVIRLYYGTQYDFEERADYATNPEYIKQEMEMFGRTKEEILSYEDSIMGPVALVLEDDMVTVKEEAKHIIPYRVKGTSFEKHPFFEASSIRKVGEKYYFIYSSMQNHELCYAVSDYPDRDFEFRGTIVSNGDIGCDGIDDANKLNMTGTTHGSIECINGQWYVFYHRLTHKSDYSRQACAEKIEILPGDIIKQVNITSCGLNDGPLEAKGSYPAVIACNITNGHMPHGCNSIYSSEFPNVNNIGDERFIAQIENNTLIGYKYFKTDGLSSIGVRARLETDTTKVKYDGPLRVDVRCENETGPSEVIDRNEKMRIDILTSIDGPVITSIELVDILEEWKEFKTEISLEDGVYSIYFKYFGNSKIQLKDVCFF